MGFRFTGSLVGMAAVASASLGAYGSGSASELDRSAAAGPVCRVALIEGEAEAGHAFERPIGNGLKVLLEPIASGWILRVIPAEGPRGDHDYAELATPPYQSVSPLLIGTDFSFRAQDALAWNPRHFRFAADRAAFASLRAAYNEELRLTKPGPAAAEAGRQARLLAAESRLAALVSQAPEAEFTILDAHLVQGSADQAQTAAMVASHLNRSAHQVEQPADSGVTPLGRINWLRFRLRLVLPAGFLADRELQVERSGCL